MTPCEVFQNMISRMLDDELGAEERAALSEHVKRCPDCAAVYVAFRSLSEAIGEDLEEPPATLRQDVMAEIRRDRVRAINKKPRRQWMSLLAAAACFTLIVSAAYLSRAELWNRPNAASETAENAMMEQALYQAAGTAEKQAFEAEEDPNRSEAVKSPSGSMTAEAEDNAKGSDGGESADQTPVPASPSPTPKPAPTPAPTPTPTPAPTPAPTPTSTTMPAPTTAPDSTEPEPTQPPSPVTSVFALSEEQSAAFRNLMSGEPIDLSAEKNRMQFNLNVNGEVQSVLVIFDVDGNAGYTRDGQTYCLTGGEVAVQEVLGGEP